MLLIISPAKTLDETSKLPKLKFTSPELLAYSKQLAGILQTRNPADIQSLMGISAKLADLNYKRFQNFKTPFTEKNARPALLTFKGDVYAPLNVADYGKKDWEYATKHLRILSGLYGVLRPLDLMQPYRLEMSTGLKNSKGRDLYAFWGSKISEKLNLAVKDSGDDVLINLASEEYFKAVDKKAFKGKLIHIVFKERHKGATNISSSIDDITLATRRRITALGSDSDTDLHTNRYKIIAIHAKRARGLMVEYAIKNHVSQPEQLKKFSSEGYAFAPKLSSETSWVFVR